MSSPKPAAVGPSTVGRRPPDVQSRKARNRAEWRSRVVGAFGSGAAWASSTSCGSGRWAAGT